jgi:lipoate-protein ligase A
MAIDLALLDRAEHRNESWLRLYRWDPPCVSFGRHEPATQQYDADRIRVLGVDTVRRPTGGRAVWHEGELTYAVASPCARFGSLRAAYLEIHLLLARALKALGIDAGIAGRVRTPSLVAGGCFSQPVGGEVLVNGRKVIGSAQRRRSSALLQHGSILLQDDQARLDTFSRGGANPWGLDPGGADVLGQLDPDDLADTVTELARRFWGGDGADAAQLECVLNEASRHYPRFQSGAWTWAR